MFIKNTFGEETVESVRLVTGDSQGVEGFDFGLSFVVNLRHDTRTPMAEKPRAIHT